MGNLISTYLFQHQTFAPYQHNNNNQASKSRREILNAHDIMVPTSSSLFKPPLPHSPPLTFLRKLNKINLPSLHCFTSDCVHGSYQLHLDREPIIRNRISSYPSSFFIPVFPGSALSVSPAGRLDQDFCTAICILLGNSKFRI